MTITIARTYRFLQFINEMNDITSPENYSKKYGSNNEYSNKMNVNNNPCFNLILFLIKIKKNEK